MTRTLGKLLCVLLLCLSNISLHHASADDQGATISSQPDPKATAESPTGSSGTDLVSANEEPHAPSQAADQFSNQTQSKSGRHKVGGFTAVSAPAIGSSIIQVTLGLFVVLVIIAATAWFGRRFGHFQATAGGSLRIIGGLHLGAKERLVVVQVGEEQLLLGVAPGRVATLHVLAKPLNPTKEDSIKEGQGQGARRASGNFREYLAAALKRGR